MQARPASCSPPTRSRGDLHTNAGSLALCAPDQLALRVRSTAALGSIDVHGLDRAQRCLGDARLRRRPVQGRPGDRRQRRQRDHQSRGRVQVNPRRLYRSRDRQLAGVAGGMAEYLDIDPTVVRILWIIVGRRVRRPGPGRLHHPRARHPAGAVRDGARRLGAAAPADWAPPAGNATAPAWGPPPAAPPGALRPPARRRGSRAGMPVPTRSRRSGRPAESRGIGAAAIVGVVLVVFGAPRARQRGAARPGRPRDHRPRGDPRPGGGAPRVVAPAARGRRDPRRRRPRPLRPRRPPGARRPVPGTSRIPRPWTRRFDPASGSAPGATNDEGSLPA